MGEVVPSMSNRIPCTELVERLKVTLRVTLEEQYMKVQNTSVGNFYRPRSRCSRVSNRRGFGTTGSRESVDRRKDQTSATSPSAKELSLPPPPRWERLGFL